MLTGSCFCGQVRYETGGTPVHPTICHCSDCRRIAGTPSVAWFTVDRSTFRYVSGGPTRFRSSAQVVREFCGTCGTHLTFGRDDMPEKLDVTIASLDNPDAVPPEAHIHAASKVGWVELCDGLPAYPGKMEA